MTQYEKQKTAILFLDFQNFILQNFVPAETAARVVEQAQKLLNAARKAGLLIIHVNVCFRPGYPEVNERNKLFSWLRDNNLGVSDDEAARIHPSLAPQPDEPVIYKRRIGAFGGTDLDMILRARNIETLCLTGVATSNVVLATFYQAFDRDYRMTIIDDACADGDEKTHHFLTGTFFPRLSDVISTDAFLEHIDK